MVYYASSSPRREHALAAGRALRCDMDLQCLAPCSQQLAARCRLREKPAPMIMQDFMQMHGVRVLVRKIRAGFALRKSGTLRRYRLIQSAAGPSPMKARLPALQRRAKLRQSWTSLKQLATDLTTFDPRSTICSEKSKAHDAKMRSGATPVVKKWMWVGGRDRECASICFISSFQ